MKFYFKIFPRLYICITIKQLTNKVQFFFQKKKSTGLLTVNLKILVKPNELRQDHR